MREILDVLKLEEDDYRLFVIYDIKYDYDPCDEEHVRKVPTQFFVVARDDDEWDYGPEEYVVDAVSDATGWCISDCQIEKVVSLNVEPRDVRTEEEMNNER